MQKVECGRSVFCTAEGKTAILPGMETPEALQQCVRREQQLWRTSMRSPTAPWRVLKPCQTVRRSVVRHRQRLAEPEPPPRRLSRWEERAASRQALGLPPYERS